MKSHKDLDVWKNSMSIVTEIYQLTKQFPDEEKFGLSSQLRRAAVSIPSNIAEGAARSSNKEFIHFLYISLGSLSELETQLLIANNLEYCQFDNDIIENLVGIRKMLLGLIKYLVANQ
ncbi:MAG: four helix bundle protein [Candidatus Marinimicrobia bacterium]|nr:four helix bundle protein [Candidatus Neomarinimicrobiota bacterium]